MQRAPYASQRLMKPEWHQDELVQYWMLSPDERALLSNKTGATRLRFAVLLKVFQYEGRFPACREDVAVPIVAHLAKQTGVPADPTPPTCPDACTLRLPPLSSRGRPRLGRLAE